MTRRSPASGSRILAALFFFIWFSNMLGYLPLPTNTEHKVDIFGLEVPSLAIYAATANISIPLVLALISVTAYHLEGIRAKGLFGYLKSWLPPGLEDMNVFGRALIFVIEAISHLVRLISLSVRLFANILAGHLLILFMARRARRAARPRGARSADLPARVRLLHLRDRPGRHPPGIHLLDLDSHLHRRRNRRRVTKKRSH